MSTTETLSTSYRGYFITKVNDAWLKKTGRNYVFSKGESIDDEPRFHWFSETLYEAKQMIDDLIAEKETPEPPSSPLSISGDNEDLEAALFAFKFYRDRIKAFTDRTPGTFKEMQSLKDRIQKWIDVTAQQIKDQKFDEETKD